jgi:WD40 repeat protein
VPGGARLNTLTGQSGPVNSVAISPDGRLLASGAYDQTIKLWSLPDGKPLPVCLMDPDVSPGVTGATYTLDGATYTVPCGSPMPSGAVCTCNCASCSCVSNPVCTCQSTCSCQSTCICNLVCTCVPVQV